MREGEQFVLVGWGQILWGLIQYNKVFNYYFQNFRPLKQRNGIVSFTILKHLETQLKEALTKGGISFFFFQRRDFLKDCGNMSEKLQAKIKLGLSRAGGSSPPCWVFSVLSLPQSTWSQQLLYYINLTSTIQHLKGNISLSSSMPHLRTQGLSWARSPFLDPSSLARVG